MTFTSQNKEYLEAEERGYCRAQKVFEFELASLGTSSCQILLALASPSLLLYALVTECSKQLAWSLAHWASENKKLLDQKETFFVLDQGTALFQALHCKEVAIVERPFVEVPY